MAAANLPEGRGVGLRTTVTVRLGFAKRRSRRDGHAASEFRSIAADQAKLRDRGVLRTGRHFAGPAARLLGAREQAACSGAASCRHCLHGDDALDAWSADSAA